MSKCLDKEVKFNVEVVSDIQNDKHTGKYKLIVPLKECQNIRNTPSNEVIDNESEEMA